MNGYQYVVLRCVPRVEREEFINVGVIVSCPARKFLEARIELDEQRLLALDPTLPTYAARTLSEHLDLPLFPYRMAAVVLGSFGVLAVLLAAIGIYGVMSYVVAGRTREVGLRVALGAARSDVLLLIMKQGMSLALIGLSAGLLIGFGAARLMVKLLFGVNPSDPLTFAGVLILLGAVAALACYIPARRAAKVDPLVALRYE